MKKTTALAPSKTDSSLGQPPATNTGSTPGTSLQALGQQLAAGVELVVARPVAGPAGDQDDLGVSAAARPGRPAAPGRPGRRAGSRPSSFLMRRDLAMSQKRRPAASEARPRPSSRPGASTIRRCSRRGLSSDQISSVTPGHGDRRARPSGRTCQARRGRCRASSSAPAPR